MMKDLTGKVIDMLEDSNLEAVKVRTNSIVLNVHYLCSCVSTNYQNSYRWCDAYKFKLYLSYILYRTLFTLLYLSFTFFLSFQLTQYVSVLRLMNAPTQQVSVKLLAAHKQRSLRMINQFKVSLSNSQAVTSYLAGSKGESFTRWYFRLYIYSFCLHFAITL